MFQNCSQDYKLNELTTTPNSKLDGGNQDNIINTVDTVIDNNTDVVTPIGSEQVNDEDLAHIKECNDAIKNIDNIPLEEGSIQNLSGMNIAKIHSLDSIQNVSGKLILIGLDENSKINLISNTSGKLILCGISIEKLENRSGTTWIIDGDVSSITSLSGNLRVINGQIGTVTNSSSNINQ